MRIDVIGARGFLGQAVLVAAMHLGVHARGLTHDQALDEDLDIALYCSGLAWGADAHAAEAYHLHVTVPSQLIAKGRFRRFAYVSSTRVYENASSTSEDAELRVYPGAGTQAYRQSKIAGELAVLAAFSEALVLRCSNLAGPSIRSNLFLSDVLRQASNDGVVSLRSSLDSSKDYLMVGDAADAIVQLLTSGRAGIFNIAAGWNTSHREILEAISRTRKIELKLPVDAPTIRADSIDVSRISAAIDWRPRRIQRDIAAWLEAFALGD